MRSATRFGGGALGAHRARAALLALLGLPGSAYIYQGQELGLPEVDVPAEARLDPMWARGGITRGGARVPLICGRNANVLVAVAMGTEPVRLPAGTVLVSAVPLDADGWLQPDNAAWIQRA